MGVDTVNSVSAAPVRLVTPKAWRYDWRASSMPSPGEVAALLESANLRRAVAGFVAACRAEQLPPAAIATRFEAFLAAYSA
jgi:hypothetical protein